MASIDVAPRSRERSDAGSARSLAPLAGVAFVALVAAAFIIGGDSPDEKASIAKIVSYYDDHQTVTVVSAALAAISLPFALMFGASVREAVGRSSTTASRWGNVALVGAGVAGVGLLVGALTGLALSDGIDNHYAGATMQTLNSLGAFSWLLFVPGVGTLGIATGAGVLSSNVISRWAGWLALVIGVACFVPFVSFFAFLLAIVWIPIVSVKLSSASA
jgi:hypothetical protein